MRGSQEIGEMSWKHSWETASSAHVEQEDEDRQSIAQQISQEHGLLEADHCASRWGQTVVRVPSLSLVSAGRQHLACFNEAREETAQLAVQGVRRPVRLDEPEQSLEYVGQHGPHRDDGTLAQKIIAKLMAET